MDNLSRHALFEKVKYDQKALEFHSQKYEDGAVYPLAKKCFQFLQLMKVRTTYQVYLDELEENLGTSNTKP
jgi:hypothetical protein